MITNLCNVDAQFGLVPVCAELGQARRRVHHHRPHLVQPDRQAGAGQVDPVRGLGGVGQRGVQQVHL